MPEISQDAFESLHPSEPPVAADVLRARANSMGCRGGHRPSMELPADVADRTKLAVDSTALKQQLHDLELKDLLEGDDEGGGERKTTTRRTRTKTISEAEMETFHQHETANEHLYGYKRKSDRRYVIALIVYMENLTFRLSLYGLKNILKIELNRYIAQFDAIDKNLGSVYKVVFSF